MKTLFSFVAGAVTFLVIALAKYACAPKPEPPLSQVRDSVTNLQQQLVVATDSIVALQRAFSLHLAHDSATVAELKHSQYPFTGFILRHDDRPTFASMPIPTDQLLVHDNLQDALLRLQGVPQLMIAWHLRAGRYRPLIERELARHHVHQNFFYAVLIESGLQPDALSPKRAFGMFQFIKAAAQDHGLVVTLGKYDERADFVKSLAAFCQYLEEAYAEFHNPLLVLASYNCGMGKTRALVKRYGNDPFAIRWSKETRRYLFSACAVTMAFSDQDRFIPSLRRIAAYPTYAVSTVLLRVKKRLPLSEVTKLLKLDARLADVFTLYNGQLLADPLPPRSYVVNIPRPMN